jgi:predicted ArsR family transcriptional regulator
VPERDGSWTFLTNHALVLISIARDPDLRIRDIAATVGITERAAQQIVRDLEGAGYVSVTKSGRRNTYRVRSDRPLRHPLQRHYRVRDLLTAFPVEGRSRTSRGRSTGKRG